MRSYTNESAELCFVVSSLWGSQAKRKGEEKTRHQEQEAIWAEVNKIHMIIWSIKGFGRRNFACLTEWSLSLRGKLAPLCVNSLLPQRHFRNAVYLRNRDRNRNGYVQCFGTRCFDTAFQDQSFIAWSGFPGVFTLAFVFFFFVNFCGFHSTIIV